MAQTLHADAGRPPLVHRRRPTIDPVRALRGFRRLVADKEDTEQVFEIMSALSGRSIPQGYQRLLDSAEGGRQAYLGVELADRLADEAWLAALPEGSVGAAYRQFMAQRGFSPEGLASESRKVADVEIDAAHPDGWYARRLRDVHDVWHVLTGYGTDALGEACVVAFSHPQTRSAGFAFIAAGAAVEFERLRKGHPYGRAIWQAWRHGRRAAWLPAQDYEALFAEPLDAARARLRIARPTFYDAVPPEARDGYRFTL
ncbi:MAG: ubiquinone biosynthesis protein [Caulobacter sp.]|nr:ubiquinone biosynthesis protein [Caulobacter sp.]